MMADLAVVMTTWVRDDRQAPSPWPPPAEAP